MRITSYRDYYYHTLNFTLSDGEKFLDLVIPENEITTSVLGVRRYISLRVEDMFIRWEQDNGAIDDVFKQEVIDAIFGEAE